MNKRVHRVRCKGEPSVVLLERFRCIRTAPISDDNRRSLEYAFCSVNQKIQLCSRHLPNRDQNDYIRWHIVCRLPNRADARQSAERRASCRNPYFRMNRVCNELGSGSVDDASSSYDRGSCGFVWRSCLASSVLGAFLLGFEIQQFPYLPNILREHDLEILHLPFAQHSSLSIIRREL